MSLARVHSRAGLGIEAPEVSVEVHPGGGLPSLSIVGPIHPTGSCWNNCCRSVSGLADPVNTLRSIVEPGASISR